MTVPVPPNVAAFSTTTLLLMLFPPVNVLNRPPVRVIEAVPAERSLAPTVVTPTADINCGPLFAAELVVRPGELITNGLPLIPIPAEPALNATRLVGPLAVMSVTPAPERKNALAAPCAVIVTLPLADDTLLTNTSPAEAMMVAFRKGPPMIPPANNVGCRCCSTRRYPHKAIIGSDALESDSI